MAEPKPIKKGPRIRKTAPTVRERAAAAQAQAQKPKKTKRLRRLRISLPNNRLGRAIRKIGRSLRRALLWIVPKYFINSWREVRLVTWPARKETWRLTLAVFIFATVFGALVYAVDKVLDEIFKNFILK